MFDLGNVIVPWERRRALEQFVDDPTEVERLADEVFTMEVNHLLDLGHPLEVIRAEIEAAHPGHGWVIDSYVEHFGHSLGPVIEGSVALVDDLLDAGVRCAGLTNWSAICWRGIPESIPVLGRLEGIVVSGEIGISKPDPAIFHHLEERFAVHGDQVLFFDDNAPQHRGGASRRMARRGVHDAGAGPGRRRPGGSAERTDQTSGAVRWAAMPSDPRA